MAVHVAEYLGQRTDVNTPVIHPVLAKTPCPFCDGNDCMKTGSGKNPVCCVRKEDRTLWIVCENRLCSTKKKLPLCPHQKTILLDIARHVFSPSVRPSDVFVKREAPLVVTGDTNYKADYIMTLKSGSSRFPGPDRIILEMQGGGETSGTEKLTAVVNAWKNDPTPTNQKLRISAGANTLEPV